MSFISCSCLNLVSSRPGANPSDSTLPGARRHPGHLAGPKAARKVGDVVKAGSHRGDNDVGEKRVLGMHVDQSFDYTESISTIQCVHRHPGTALFAIQNVKMAQSSSAGGRLLGIS